jgi:hypothetical protein
LEWIGAKTNHLPNIQGEPGSRPLPDGARNRNFRSDLADSALGRDEFIIIPSAGPVPAFTWEVSGGYGDRLIESNSRIRKSPVNKHHSRDDECATRGTFYSAAAIDAFDAFVLAADIMKSEIRGTISDLNREPLNTP